jgi:nucleotide-binding universal stress UspA family protein
MPPRILIPVDESETTQHMLATLLENRDLLTYEFLLLHVVDIHLVHRLVPDIQKHMIYDAAEKSGLRILNNLAGPLREAGLKPVLRLELGTPAACIQKVAEELESELIILGRHLDGGGLSGVMFDSIANQLIRAVKCPVLLL